MRKILLIKTDFVDRLSSWLSRKQAFFLQTLFTENCLENRFKNSWRTKDFPTEAKYAEELIPEVHCAN